jgi:hypothetical protein
MDLLHTLDTLYSTLLCTVVFAAMSSQPLLGRGLQRRMFPFLWVRVLSHGLSNQFLAAAAHNDGTAEVL